MPGSQIYFVWASDVTGSGSTGTSLRESLRDLGNIFPKKCFSCQSQLLDLDMNDLQLPHRSPIRKCNEQASPADLRRD